MFTGWASDDVIPHRAEIGQLENSVLKMRADDVGGIHNTQCRCIVFFLLGKNAGLSPPRQRVEYCLFYYFYFALGKVISFSGYAEVKNIYILYLSVARKRSNFSILFT